MDPDSPPPDSAESSYSTDTKVIAAVKKFTAVLDSVTPNWRSQLSPTDKFICGHKYPIDPTLLTTPPERH
jgi:hypothetical protein